MQYYNTGKEPIIVREFGRNFQKMILFAKDVPGREQRQSAIERIVDLILEMYPVNNRNIEDYKIKIWSHILQICEYELDVDIPENIPARKEKIKPETVPYSSGRIKLKHYGKGIERLIDKASEMEDDERRTELIRVIGAFMKMCYKNWNRDNASDDVVAQEMRMLSRGRINLALSTNINFLIQPQTKVSGGNSILNQQKKPLAGTGKPFHRNVGSYNRGNQGGQGGNQGNNNNNQGNNNNNQGGSGGNQGGLNRNKFNRNGPPGGNQGGNNGNNQGGNNGNNQGGNNGNNQGGNNGNNQGGSGDRNFKKKK